MTPIHDILSRIRWDPAWAEDNYEIGVLDRITGEIEFHDLSGIAFPENAPRTLEITTADHIVQVPFHRVREVRRNGRTFWKRPDAPGESPS